MCSLRPARVVLLRLSSRLTVNAADKTMFVEGAPQVGCSNRRFFDAENKLDVARADGRAITKIDPETGDIISQLGIEDSVIFPDDVTIAPDRTYFWTDIFVGTIGRRPPGGPSEFLYEPGTYPTLNIDTLKSLAPVHLDHFSAETLLTYFNNTWELYNMFFSSITKEGALYKNPDPSRHPLIFYLGHTAAFCINKLVIAGLLLDSERINPDFERIFEQGVDPAKQEELGTAAWPTMEEVKHFG